MYFKTKVMQVNEIAAAATTAAAAKLLNIILYFRGASAHTYLYALAWLLWLAARLIMVSKQF